MHKRISKWFSGELSKLRPMNARQRAEYLVYYYWRWVVALLIVALLGGYIADAVARSRKQNILEGFFTNDDFGLFNASEIEEDYTAGLSLTQNQQVVFDDALYIDLGGQATAYTEASNSKVMAYITTGELDFIVSTEEVFDFYHGNLKMLDLTELLSPEQLAALSSSLVTEVDENGNVICTALDMAGSRFLCDFDGTENDATYLLFAPYNAPHIEQLADFIAYCFDLPRQVLS